MNDTIAIYEEVCGITNQMLAAAREADWESLEALERQCSGRIDLLRVSDSSDSLSEDERQIKIGIIRKILDDDRQIREIVSPWVAQLAALINRSGTERKLNRAYGMNQSG